MYIGFDYGSANCAVGLFNGDSVSLLPLDGDDSYLSSTLYSYDSALIAEAVLARLPEDLASGYRHARAAELSRAAKARRDWDLAPNEQTVFVGRAAIEHYLEFPGEGFYVRSPKSFLGAVGLRPEQQALFEDIVTLMMQEIKARAERVLGSAIRGAVIGRPVNFQGIGGEDSNRQAESILRLAAARAGLEEVSFLYEPLAAGFDFEARLEADATVLVVDVGGGTTDCSLVRMGPSHKLAKDRSQDCLGHSGQRIGGNDLDIALAMQAFMPSFGLGSSLVTGKPMPSQPFWQAVAVNDVSAQRDFAALATGNLIKELKKDASQPELLTRFERLRSRQQNFHLVRLAEAVKVALGEADSTRTGLPNGEEELEIGRLDFNNAIGPQLEKIAALMHSAVQNSAEQNAGAAPDIVYVTGGSSRCQAVAERIGQVYPGVPVVSGDHFGSVTAGLARAAAALNRK
ncbi:molecular chaperone [Shewanella cyperi]|uniref:molecular chaperone n=1 Tax=Shewanella cyperi TaxID=2814292 RepID=UPI001A945690|nr:molecular chaperone [Shewanella cyperi]QSX42237.1 molecular chaperone [Shewanella cyperi]